MYAISFLDAIYPARHDTGIPSGNLTTPSTRIMTAVRDRDTNFSESAAQCQTSNNQRGQQSNLLAHGQLSSHFSSDLARAHTE